jgi:hypothetical protein
MDLRKKTDDFLDSAELLAGWVRDSLGNPDYSKLRLEANRRYQENLDSLRSWYRAFIRENESSILAIMALQNQVGPGIYVLDPMTDYPLYYRVDSLLSSAYPRSKAVIAFNERLDRIQRRKREAYENPRMSVGEKTGNYTLPGKNGKPFTLLEESSALILLDFRNSLCKPCDRNDSLYRKILDTYENRKLRLYQVYLNPPNINQHAEEPADIPENWDIVYAQKGWDSEIIRNTGITKVPANFLLKGNGLILEKDIFGDELELRLKNLNESL